MRYTVAALASVAFFVTFARPTVAQEVGPNAPHYVKSVKVPGLDVRYLDFKWDEEAFNTLQKGGPHPVGRRSWVLARLLVTLDPFRCAGKIIPVGPALLILNPAQAGAGPTLELRYVDLREVFTNLNVVAEPPSGETYYQAPAALRQVDKKAGRLEVTLTEGKGSIDLITHYGDREARITLVRF
jgi:hypothetical protein